MDFYFAIVAIVAIIAVVAVTAISTLIADIPVLERAPPQR